MISFQCAEGLRFLTFKSFTLPGLVHGVFTRQGGISPEPWSGLNLGGTVGDDPDRVSENRRRAFQALERRPESSFDVWQVHGKEVVCAVAPRPPDVPHLRADAILTDCAEVTLIMRFADCVPIMLYHPTRRVVGLAHAGWQGTVKRTAAAAVEGMETRYGCRPDEIVAAIGPSIGAHHYAVGPEVVQQVREAFGPQADELLPVYPRNGGGRVRSGVQSEPVPQEHFDLWAANRMVLAQAGVQQVEVAEICTACHPGDWFSYRGEGGRTGRFGAIISLKE